MMMNMFSIFDPSTSMYFSFNWTSLLLIFIILPYKFWIIPSRLIFLWNSLFNLLFNEFKILINYSFSNITIFISLFISILMNNFMGLFPYIFTASSHMSFCMSLSISMWMGIMIYSIINYLNDLFTHLTPMGTPPILMPFMVLIESISLMIRPLTLSIRLTANMIAGHLLMSLLGSSGQDISSLSIFSLMIISQTILMILEMSVSIIQAYVFSILIVLYSSEI